MSSSVLEMPSAQEPIVVAARVVPDSVMPSSLATSATANFTDDEVDSLHQDDAMAAGMIAVILGIAFTVLLGLVISVTVWTALSAG